MLRVARESIGNVLDFKAKGCECARTERDVVLLE